MKRRTVSAVAAAAGMMVLIFDGQTALKAAQEGIELCLRTLIPSLLPFFIFSILLTGSLNGQELRILRPLEQLCHIPKGSGSLLVVGFLGGYPVGAQNIRHAHRSGRITKPCAERMLAFCNNAGPAFLFGIIGCAFSDPVCPWLLWFIHIVGALTAAVLTPGVPETMETGPEDRGITLPQAVEKSIRVMGTVCGWVILFRLILSFLDRWILWLFPVPTRVLLTGLLELSNGCVLLESIPGTGLRFLIASVMLSCGGFCVAMQTRSVCDGLSLRLFYRGKMIQTAVSILLAGVAQIIFPAWERVRLEPILIFTAAALVLCVMWMKHRKNSSSIPASFGV